MSAFNYPNFKANFAEEKVEDDSKAELAEENPVDQELFPPRKEKSKAKVRSEWKGSLAETFDEDTAKDNESSHSPRTIANLNSL